jgi:CHRD domain/PEP-CTERM motif
MKRTIVFAALLLFASLACASTITYTASLSGPAESPPNASPGIGFATVTYDSVTHLLGVNVTFSGLLGTTTASHIHCCTALPFTSTAGVATQLPTFTGFPLGVTSGTYSNSFDLTLASSWNPAFITTVGGTTALAEAALAAALNNGKSYLNIHSTVVPGGEIRGFLVAPEPGTLVLLGSSLLGLFAKRRRNN